MSLHDPFGYLKHKLWPKERPWIKLAIWFPTIKSRELPWVPCVQVTCYTLLESSRQGVQLCFRPHLNRRFAHTKLWVFKVVGVPILGISGLPFGSLGTKWHLGAGLVAMDIIYYKGEDGGFPKFGSRWVLWVRFCLWFIHVTKVFQLRIDQLVVWFV
jgi:hypothetical protein